MFNVSIREYFSVLNVYIICIRNTTRSKSNPLRCTHVDSYMFSTLHPPGVDVDYHKGYMVFVQAKDEEHPKLIWLVKALSSSYLF